MLENTKKFSLKDELFNARKVEQIAKEIQSVYAKFESTAYREYVLSKFPELKPQRDLILSLLGLYVISFSETNNELEKQASAIKKVCFAFIEFKNPTKVLLSRYSVLLFTLAFTGIQAPSLLEVS